MASSSSLLTFPPSTFAALSPSRYLAAHLSSPSHLRPNGRSPNQFRTPAINAGSLTHAHGSAVVRLGNTAVVAGVRGEILRREDIPLPYDDLADARGPEDDSDEDETVEKLGLLVPNVELSTGCSPQHVPGNAPSSVAQSLVHRVREGLRVARLVRPGDLRIWSVDGGKRGIGEGDEEEKPKVMAYWTLYIDILFIALDGGAFDAAWGAALAALRDVKLSRAWWDREREMVVCSDRVEEARALSLRGLPVSAGMGIFVSGNKRVKGDVVRGFGTEGVEEETENGKDEAWILADMDTFEEGRCGEEVTVLLDCSTRKSKILKIEKNGGLMVGLREIDEVVKLAETRWSEWSKALDTAKR
ncbi:MAG: hypothetical protein M1820_010536 [Bogoriella megaspora]|nr:MAG: hypothetical protein M1820_010536 [Bogoriella megaspora]